MFFIHWLSRTSRQSHSPRQPNRDRTKERRLKLLRLEQRRVLNADFTFAANALHLDNIDGDLTVREVSGSTGLQIEFDLHGSLWQDDASTGVFAIDNSTPGHSILSIAKSDLESLSSGVSLHAASSEFDLQFDVQSSALDLSQMHGTLVAEGFGEIQQTAANGHQVRLGDVSLSADHITLSQFHGDDITLNANEIDLTGGADSFSGSTLSIHSAATPQIELGGTSDTLHELNLTDSDITALDAGFHRINFEATSADAASSIHVDPSGADFNHAITPSHDGSLHLTADSVQIDGALSISGGLIDVTATHAATITATGSLISHGGNVHVDAGESGTLLDSGRVDVSNSEPGGIGGTVHLLGEQVGLFGGAVVDASGHSGGGEVLIGGDLHGDNAAIHHAAQTFIGHDVEIHADALHHGDGGQVVVWSDEVTQVYGALTARGGALLGDGGLIETSSHQQLIVTRGGDASAVNGHAGMWLLDPLNVKIVAVRVPPPDVIFGVTEFATPPFFTPTISGSEVTDEAIEEQLRMGTTVVISTFNPDGAEAGDVTQEADALIDVTFDNAGDSATFIISAANDIFLNGGITAMNGNLHVLLEANTGSDDPIASRNLGNVTINANIDTNGGSFTSTGVDFTSTAATITAAGGVSITHTGTVNLGVINTGSDSGGTTFISGANVIGTIDVGEGNVFIDGGNPDLIVMANITATGTIFLLADRDVIVEATVTAGFSPLSPMDLDPSADLSITADADSAPDPTMDSNLLDDRGGFWLREAGNMADAKLNAGGNITIVGADLAATTSANVLFAGTTDSLRIEAADPTDATDLQIVAGQDLTIVANSGNVSGAGDIVIDGMMTATDGTLTVFFTDTAFLSANQTAGTDILFQNAVQLTGNVTIIAGNDATFGSTVDDDGNPTTGSALTVTGPANIPPPGNTPAGGDVLFVGKVGGIPNGALAALTVNGDGLIDFLNSVTVDDIILVTATSETGRVTFQDVVTTNAGSVTITNAGLLVTSSSAQFNVATDFVQNGAGSTELGAGITTMNGDVSFTQGVLLTRAQQTMPPDPLFNPLTTIDTSRGNKNITFGGTIDSEVAGENEEQTISLVNLTGPTFTISWDPPNPPGTVSGMPQVQVIETTGNIAIGASAAMVKDALVALDSLTADDINVTGDPGGPFTLTFLGAFRGTNVNEVTVAGVGLPFPAPDPVLTTIQGQAIIAEHNPLTLIAGTGMIKFQGNIGAGFVDVGLGVDGDQTLGNLTIASADKVTFTNVETVAANGQISLGVVSANGVITNGIVITGTNPIAFASDQSILVNGAVTSNVDLSLQAAGDITLTAIADITTTANNNITIVADANGDSVGNFVMTMTGANATEINAGSGFIDIRAAEVFLGKLTSTSPNSTADENPAIRVIATFRAINDINDEDFTDVNLNGKFDPGETFTDANGNGMYDDRSNLIAEQRTNSNDTGAGVVLNAVMGIGSTNNALETELASLSAFNHDLSEQQLVTLANATGGTFTLAWNPPGIGGAETTNPIPFNATAAQVKTELLRTFDTLTNADLDVSGKAGGPYILTFLGALQVTNVPQVITANVDLIGVGASVTSTTIANPQDANPQRALNNIVIRDVGTNNGERVDLIFVHNQANQFASPTTPQFASAKFQFASVDASPTAGLTVKTTEITFSAATPGPTSNDIVINFTKSQHTNFTTTPPSGNTIGIPVITIDPPFPHTINIDLDIGEVDTNANGFLDPAEDLNKNGTFDGTTANALRDAINSNHAANQLIRARITGTDPTSDARAPGTDDITATVNGTPITTIETPLALNANPASIENGVININVENGSLRVVTDNSRLVLSEMQRGIDTFNPPDLAIAAIQSENTIKLTANTIEVFDDILAISAKTQVTTPTYTQATTALDNVDTTLTVVDTSLFPTIDANPASTDFFIQINSEILAVTDIDFANNELTVVRGQGGTLAATHLPAPILAPFDGLATKLFVVDPSALPPVDSDPSTTDYFIRIDSEVLAVTDLDLDGNLLTVLRGQNGTAAGAHVPGTLIADVFAIHPTTRLGTSAVPNTPISSLTVVDPTFIRDDGDPTTPILVQIESEVLAVTDVVGDQLMVVRGQNGTAAAAHAAGTLITQVGNDTGIRQYIEIQARTNFVLGADRVISTDDHYLNSLNVAEDLNGNGRLDAGETFTDANGNGQFDAAEPFTDMNGNRVYDLGEPFADVTFDSNGMLNGVFDPNEPFADSNGNGRFDLGEDFNGDGVLQFNTGEDINRNGVLDPNEDTNGDGTLQLRGDKPTTALNDDFFSQINHDVIHITADSTFTGTNGQVLLGENSTISTDNGIEQLISPRPVFNRVNNGVFEFQPGTAFFSGDVVVSELTTRFLSNAEVLPDGTILKENSIVFLGTLTFTIGAPGEKNLVLDIDWGDHDRTLVSEIPPTTANTVAPRFDVANGVYVFDPTKDQNATRYLIPEGGAKYSIPHEFSENAFNLKAADGRQPIQEPGRATEVTTDPIQVRFAVSQHSSIVIDGRAVLDPRVPPENVATAPAAVPQNAPFDNSAAGKGVNFPKEVTLPSSRPISLSNADPLFQLSSTDVLDDPDLFLPRFDIGIAAVTIPTPPTPPPQEPPPPNLPPALPKPFIPDAAIIITPQLTTESARSSATSSSVTTDEYFELRRTNDDGSVTAERLSERAGESLLNREEFEKFVRELGDGEYEIFFITRDNKDGTTIPRSVIQFRLESGRLAPPANDSPNLFKPFKLIPVPKVLQPVQPVPPNKPNANGAADDQNPDAPNDGNPKPSDDELSALPLHERHSDASSWLGPLSGTALAAVNSISLSGTALAAGDSTIESETSDSSESSPMAVGLLLMAGTRWRKNRFNPLGSSLFSKTARLARKRVATADDQ